MTRAELKKYAELQQIFEKDVDRVTDILVKDQKRYRDFNYYDKSWLELGGLAPDMVHTEGTDTWGYGGEEFFSGEFPAEWLTWDNDRLKKMVECSIEEDRKKQEVDEMKKRDREEDEERSLYEKLKQKYG